MSISDPGLLRTVIAVYAIITAGVAVYILGLSIMNIAWLFHTTFVKPSGSPETVSVLIPARNEAQSLGPCLDSLLVQTRRNIEIIIYDDDSDDGTGQIAREYAEKYPLKVRVIQGKGLEEGWYGKPHALQRLSEQASGEWLLFTDADTIHSPESVATALALARYYRADLVTGYTRIENRSFGEAETIPSIFLLSMAVMPLWLSHRSRRPFLSHAIGQYMFFRASTYRKAGGYASVRTQVTEDVRMARQIKKAGGRVLFADLKDVCSCRMYGSYSAAMAGLSKNVFDYVDKRTGLLVAATVAIPLFFLLPILGSVWMPDSFAAAAQPFFRLHTLCMLYAWLLVSIDRRLPWYVPLIYPLILINTLSMGWRAADHFRRGEALMWKGRMVR